LIQGKIKIGIFHEMLSIAMLFLAFLVAIFNRKVIGSQKVMEQSKSHKEGDASPLGYIYTLIV